MALRPRNPTDLVTGLIFVGLGITFLVVSGNYRLGTARQMGPGYFPTALGILLALLGLVLSLKSQFGKAGALESFSWRPLLLVVVASVLFGLTVRGAGLVPAIVLLTVTSFAASDRFRPTTAVALAAALSLFSWGLFRVGLGLPLPAFGTWFGS
jgi:hypothetical protein